MIANFILLVKVYFLSISMHFTVFNDDPTTKDLRAEYSVCLYIIIFPLRHGVFCVPVTCVYSRALCTGDVKLCIQIGSDSPQMGQIWDFFKSVSVHFGSASQNVLELILKRLGFVPFGANMTQFGCEI